MQARYDGYRYSTYGNRRSGKKGGRYSGNAKQKGEKSGARLIICAFILACSLIVKTFFPSAVDTVRKNMLPVIDRDIDYKGAITALGDTLTGDKGVMQVLGEVYTRAFGEKTDNDLQVIDANTEEPVIYGPQILLKAGTSMPGKSADALRGVQESVESVQEIADEASESEIDPVVEAFLLNQAQFSEYGLPESVSYDMPVLSIDEYTLPVFGFVSSSFGFRDHPIDGDLKFHYGTDVAANTGDPVCAFADGTVLAAGESTSLGLYILIEHDGGVKTQYAHCSELYVDAGAVVAEGEKVAAVGETGAATGPHLHFELIVDGEYVNPEYYLSFE